MCQYNTQSGRLNLVQSIVKTPKFALIAIFQPMISGLPEMLRQFLVVGRDHPSVANGVEMLQRVETKSISDTKRSDRPIPPTRAHGLRGVFNNRQVVPFGDFAQCRHSDRPAR